MKETKQGRPEKFKGGSKIRPFRVPLSEPYQTETISKIKKVLDGVAKEMKQDDNSLESPYLIKTKTKIITTFRYNPSYGDDRICKCGHPYHRHFDSYENMNPVGCKYCGCNDFEEQII